MDIYRRVIEEHRVDGHRLGRNVGHDPRSLAYPYRNPVTLTSARHSCNIATLDQGDLGSCTGNATITALASSPLFDTLSKAQQISLNEAEAIRIYSLATGLDSYPGVYPPEDTGSDGLDAAKAAQQLGFINGYTHALSLNDALSALVAGPVIVGVDWWSNFDLPKTNGEMPYGGTVRGGHELCLDQIDVENQRVWAHNSWGDSWGQDGRAWFSFTTLGKLLSSDGDCTVFVPLTAPVPTPIPTPPTPAPVPTPTIVGIPLDDPGLLAMVAAGDKWEHSIVSKITQAGRFKASFDALKGRYGLK